MLDMWSSISVNYYIQPNPWGTAKSHPLLRALHPSMAQSGNHEFIIMIGSYIGETQGNLYQKIVADPPSYIVYLFAIAIAIGNNWEALE